MISENHFWHQKIVMIFFNIRNSCIFWYEKNWFSDIKKSNCWSDIRKCFYDIKRSALKCYLAFHIDIESSPYQQLTFHAYSLSRRMGVIAILPRQPAFTVRTWRCGYLDHPASRTSGCRHASLDLAAASNAFWNNFANIGPRNFIQLLNQCDFPYLVKSWVAW